MALRSGNLDRRIEIQRAVETRDELNNPITGWVRLKRVWASKQDVSDSERVRAAHVGSVITTRFVIRWSPLIASVNAKDRLVHGGLIYNIVGVKEVGRREGIEITGAATSDLYAPTPPPDLVPTYHILGF